MKQKAEKDFRSMLSVPHISILDESQSLQTFNQSNKSLEKSKQTNELNLPSIKHQMRPQPIARRMMTTLNNKKNQLLLH